MLPMYVMSLTRVTITTRNSFSECYYVTSNIITGATSHTYQVHSIHTKYRYSSLSTVKLLWIEDTNGIHFQEFAKKGTSSYYYDFSLS